MARAVPQGDETLSSKIGSNVGRSGMSAPQGPFRHLPKLAARKAVIQLVGGQIVMHEATCNELLELVRQNCNLDASNHRGLLTYRDCKQLLSSTDTRPKIDTRFECILAHLYPVAVLVLRESVLVVANENVAMDNLLQQLAQISAIYHGAQAFVGQTESLRDYETSNLPFEVSILQCCFTAAILEAHTELEALEEKFRALETASESKVRYKHVSMALHELKQPAARVLETVSGYKDMMEELLSDPEESLLLEFSNHPAIYGKHATPYSRQSGMESANVDVEILLEYVDQEIEQLFSRARVLTGSLDNLERHINMQLAITRNELMRFELMTSIISTALAFGACLSGLFGMNVVNGFESSHAAFIWVCVLVTVVSLAACAVARIVLLHTRL